MVRILIVPGWRDAAESHWQNLWAQRFVHATAVELDSWARPVRDVWLRSITRAIDAQPGPVVVVAHGLACIAVTQLPAEVSALIRGALLVAPADPERRGALADFAPVPADKLPYRNILVACASDPHCPVRLAGAYARAWGSEFVRLPVPAQAEWPLGEALLQSLCGDRPLEVRAGAAGSVPSLVSLETA